MKEVEDPRAWLEPHTHKEQAAKKQQQQQASSAPGVAKKPAQHVTHGEDDAGTLCNRRRHVGMQGADAVFIRPQANALLMLST